MNQTHTVQMTVNGSPAEVTVEARRLLSDTLREDLDLTSVHVGCEHGVCGACTVLIDGKPQRSCLLFAAQMDGCEIETIDSWASSEEDFHPIQQAFWEKHGLQCGFCTPGIMLTVKEFLSRYPDPTEEEIRSALAGNICRCTGYVFIVDAVKSAAEAVRMQ
jgi:carbon-monoxide dehydrogenase small subunit